MTSNRQNHVPNHNTQPTPNGVELLDAEKAVLDVAVADELRALQLQQRTNLMMDPQYGYGDTAWHADWLSGIDAELDRFLIGKGLDVNSPNYTEVKDTLRSVSLDRMDNDWLVGSQNPDGSRNLSGREAFIELTQQRLQQDDAMHLANNGMPDRDELNRLHEEALVMDARRDAIDEIEEELADLRGAWAVENAKRQDRFFSLKSKKREQLRDEYHAMVQELGRRHLELHQDMSDDEKNMIAMTIIFDEQEKLRQQTIEELEGKPLGKFIKWMNKGNVATRILKGVGVGALAGIAGSFVAGAVGATVVAGGAVAASRFARNFAIKDNKTRGMASIFSDDGKSSSIDFDADELNTGAAMNFTDDNNRMKNIAKLTGANEAFEADTKNEQKKRVKSALFGTAMMGVGAFAGYGVHKGIEWMSGKDLTFTGYVHDKVSDFFNGDSQQPGGSTNPTDQVPGGDTPANNPNTGFDLSDIPQDARWVDPGEGWYQTFQELGIPRDHWANVLQDAGPRLHEQGWAYRMPDGQWGISQPGRLPNSALSEILKSAKRDGFTLAS